jgi:hypothetical protein
MNPPNGQTPLDYLNQIAPVTPKRPRFELNKRTILFGAGIAVVFVILLAIVVNVIGSSRTAPWQQLSARLATTHGVAVDATSKLKNSQIRSANSNLGIYLTNTRRDLTAPLALKNIDPEKLPESVTINEADALMIQRLEDARLNAKYDSTYAREMSYKLSTILSLYQELFNSTGDPNTKLFLETAYNNLLPIQETFANFSASNE